MFSVVLLQLQQFVISKKHNVVYLGLLQLRSRRHKLTCAQWCWNKSILMCHAQIFETYPVLPINTQILCCYLLILRWKV